MDVFPEFDLHAFGLQAVSAIELKRGFVVHGQPFTKFREEGRMRGLVERLKERVGLCVPLHHALLACDSGGLLAVALLALFLGLLAFNGGSLKLQLNQAGNGLLAGGFQRRHGGGDGGSVVLLLDLLGICGIGAIPGHDTACADTPPLSTW